MLFFKKHNTKDEKDEIENNPVKQVYDQQRVENLDKDVEIAILYSCGYKIPNTMEEMNILGGKLISFMDELSEEDRFSILEQASIIAKRRRMITKAGYKIEEFDSCKKLTPLEWLNASSNNKSDIFKQFKHFKPQDKKDVLESIMMGFEIQHEVIDSVEDIIIQVGYQG
jgi:hypothetical protein